MAQPNLVEIPQPPTNPLVGNQRDDFVERLLDLERKHEVWKLIEAGAATYLCGERLDRSNDGRGDATWWTSGRRADRAGMPGLSVGLATGRVR